MSSPVPSDPAAATDQSRKNRRLALICTGVFAGMVGLAFASVPLYDAFCRITGFDGTVSRAEAAPTQHIAPHLLAALTIGREGRSRINAPDLLIPAAMLMALAAARACASAASAFP